MRPFGATCCSAGGELRVVAGRLAEKISMLEWVGNGRIHLSDVGVDAGSSRINPRCLPVERCVLDASSPSASTTPIWNRR